MRIFFVTLMYTLKLTNSIFRFRLVYLLQKNLFFGILALIFIKIINYNIKSKEKVDNVVTKKG